MKHLQKLEQLAAAAIVGAIILLAFIAKEVHAENFPMIALLPASVPFLAGIYLLWRVKAAQRARARLLGEQEPQDDGIKFN